jgi:50S ribosomal subunit-associated GTPase HflX
VALVGYTNVGKSAFMNAVLKKNEVESKDMLFQTLKTTSR